MQSLNELNKEGSLSFSFCSPQALSEVKLELQERQEEGGRISLILFPHAFFSSHLPLQPGVGLWGLGSLYPSPYPWAAMGTSCRLKGMEVAQLYLNSVFSLHNFPTLRKQPTTPLPSPQHYISLPLSLSSPSWSSNSHLIGPLLLHGADRHLSRGLADPFLHILEGLLAVPLWGMGMLPKRRASCSNRASSGYSLVCEYLLPTGSFIGGVWQAVDAWVATGPLDFLHFAGGGGCWQRGSWGRGEEG